MSMTRTDFNSIAEIIRKLSFEAEPSSASIQTLYIVADKLAVYFKQANPSFDRSRFIRACGWYDE